MTLDQLEVLETIVQFGSFRAASEHLNRAQSAVSYAVRTLESDLGVEIFDRSQYRPRLTAAGERVLARSRGLLRGARDLRRLAETISSGVEPRLRISVSILMPIRSLIPALTRLRQEFPQTQVDLEFEVLFSARRIRSEEIDIGIASIDKHQDQLVCTPINQVEMIKVCAPKHPLADVRNRSELNRYPQLVIRDPHSPPDRQAGVVAEDGNWRIPDFATKREFLINSLGWGHMPKHEIEDDLKSGRLMQFDSQAMALELSLVHHQRYHLGPAATAFMEELT